MSEQALTFLMAAICPVKTADGAGLSFLEALALAETSAPGGAILETSGLGEDATLITTLSAPLTLTSSFTFNGLSETTASDPLPTVVNINSNVGFANLAGNGTVFSNIASDFIFLDNSTGFVSSAFFITGDDITFDNSGAIAQVTADPTTAQGSLITVSGDNFTINNAVDAQLVSGSRGAIQQVFTGFGTAGSVNTIINNDGLIQSTDDALRIPHGEINNTGTIRSTGEFAQFGPIQDALSAFGTVSASDLDADGVALTIINSGTFQGPRGGIIANGNTFIDNSGLIEGGEFGVLLQTTLTIEDGIQENLVGTLINSGTIRDTGTLVDGFTGNSGLTLTGGQGLVGIEVTNSGLIESSSNVGSVAIASSLIATTIINETSGVITGGDGLAFQGSQLEDFQAGVFSTFVSSVAAFANFGVLSSADGDIIVQGDGTFAIIIAGLTFSLDVTAQLAGQIPVTFVTVDGETLLVLAQIDIAATLADGIVTYVQDADGNFLPPDNFQFETADSGTLVLNGTELTTLDGDPIFNVPDDVNFDDTIENAGIINGDINTGLGNDTITNDGTINGNVFLGEGNDVFISGVGSTVGTISGGAGNDQLISDGFDSFDGGSGTDTVDFSGAGAGVNAALGGTVTANQVPTVTVLNDGSTDLSGDGSAPTAFTLTEGTSQLSNTVINAAGAANLPPQDVDIFTITVAEGDVLTEVVLSNFVSTDNVGFFGVVEGNTFPADSLGGGFDVSLLLGQTLFGTGSGADVGDNALIALGSGAGAIGFDGAAGLTAGTYTFLVQQLGGDQIDFTLDFIVESATGPGTLNNVENIIGTNFDDTLIGDANDNILDGGAGLDTAVFSGNFADYNIVLNGDGSIIISDNNVADGDDGADILLNIESLQFADVQLATDGSNEINGSSANDFLTGTLFGDIIDGLEGDDLLRGEGGDDVIRDGAGNDIAIGGAGDDVFIAGTGANDFRGNAGSDTVDFSELSGRATVNLATQTVSAVPGEAGDDVIIGIENLVGTDGNDFFIGTSGMNSLDGGAGDDVINGGVGNDTIRVGEGDDLAIGGDGNDVFIAGTGVNEYRGNAGLDTVDFSELSESVNVNLLTQSIAGSGEASDDTIASIDNLIGTVFNDTLVGNTGRNQLEGGEGDDLLSGGGGNDFLFDGAGNDTVVGGDGLDRFFDGDGDDILLGGAGNDIFFAGDGANTYNGNAGVDVIDYSGFTLGVVVDLEAQTNSSDDTIIAVENLFGSAQGDIFIGTAVSNSLLGRGGDDVLDGGGGNDVLLGGSGDDIIFDGTGNDLSLGGSGNDIFIAGTGADTYNGNAGVDVVDYSNLTTGITIDLQTGQHTGEAENDILTSIEGVIGTTGNDTLTGSAIANRLGGDQGDDTLTGLGGADIFEFDGDSGGEDTITDFSIADGDVIELALLGGDVFTSIEDIEDDITQDGADTLIDFGNGNSLRLNNVDAATLSDDQFIFVEENTSSDLGQFDMWLA